MPKHIAAQEQHGLDLALQMMAIPGKSGEEKAIAQFIVERLLEWGVRDAQIRFDGAHRRSPHGGQTGNLIVKLPGTFRGPRRLLMAHMDTVPLCVGSQPVRDGALIRSADPETALGGDNRAGAAVVLNSVRDILCHDRPHPPLTMLWTIQEEVGLVGARHVSLSALSQPKLCFNWDGGAPNTAVIAATGCDHVDMRIDGVASHAGAHPEQGVNALSVLSLAMTDLNHNGWLGLICKGRHSGTSNLGVVSGGQATNVVMPRVEVLAEVRSHKRAFRKRIVDAFRKALLEAARQLPSSEGRRAKVHFSSTLKYEAFRLSSRLPVVRTALNAVAQAGLEPQTRSCNGGLDANWLIARGLPTVTLGCGQAGIHTVEETLHVESYLAACRVAAVLAAGDSSTAS